MSKSKELYEIGCSVRVLDDVRDPDYPDSEIGGWQGRVFDVTEDDDGEKLLGVQWDSVTLRRMSKDIIGRAEREGNEFSVMYLHAKDLELVSPRDTVGDALRVAEQIAEAFE